MPVEYRIIYKILLLLYKAINVFSPSFISILFSFCNNSYSKLLQVPRSKLKSWSKIIIISSSSSSSSSSISIIIVIIIIIIIIIIQLNCTS